MNDVERPDMMSALVLGRLEADYAGCRVEPVPTPSPSGGEVLVRIEAAAVGFPDLLMTEGKYQYRPELPFVLGGEAAGRIVALGEGMSTLAVGDRVAAFGRGGAFAEFGVFDARSVRKVPASLDVENAAAFQVAYLTAYVALVERAKVQPDEWVVVHGAAGGVGLAAVDLAKALGARVIATSSSDAKLEAIRRCYAPDETINISEGFRERVKAITGGGAAVVYDPVGGDVFDESVRCLKWGGRLLTVGFASGRIPQLPVNKALIKGLSLLGVRAGEFTRQSPLRGRQVVDRIWELAAQGKIRPHVHAVHPLAEWRTAFDQIASRQVVGRAVLSP